MDAALTMATWRLHAEDKLTLLFMSFLQLMSSCLCIALCFAQISVFARHACDELLLLASDGLWDVLSNQEATDLALRSIKRAREKGASRKAAARVAATVLTKAAVDRGSRDNITVVIIDLSPPPAGGEKAEKPSAAAAAQPDAAGTAAPPQQHEAEGQQQQPQPEAAAEGACRPSSGRSNSSHSSRQGSMKTGPSRSGSGSASNPFAAAAVSPFSTAATGSSELPLPPCAAHLDAGTSSAASERSARNSAGGGSANSSSRLRSSAAGASNSSAFAAQAASGALSTEMGSAFSNQAGVSGLATELDSLDLSGAQAVRGHSRRGSRGNAQHMYEASGSATTAGNSSIASSQLEEQPTIIEPPPEVDLYRQPSSSPFSTCQGPAFGDDTT